MIHFHCVAVGNAAVVFAPSDLAGISLKSIPGSAE
jgi:hypothetical protein